MWHRDDISFPTGSDLIPQRSSGLWGLSSWAPGCWASFMQEPPLELLSEAASDSRGGGGGGGGSESRGGSCKNPSPVGLNRNVSPLSFRSGAALWNQEAEQFYQFTFSAMWCMWRTLNYVLLSLGLSVAQPAGAEVQRWEHADVSSLRLTNCN